MKFLVIGRSGQVVRSLAERVNLRPDLELVAVGRPDLDLEVSGSAERAIAAAGADVVVNAAAYTAVDQAEDEPDLAFRINGEGAGEVAAAAARLGAPIIHLSTDYVFDGRSEGAYTEDSAVNPINVYGRSKLVGEEMVREANSRHLILRTAWVYSPFGRNFVKTMMAAAETHDCLTVVDDQRGNPSSALDLAEGIIRIADMWGRSLSTSVGTYHLAGTGTASWFGFAQAIMEGCKIHKLPAAEIRPVSSDEWPTRAVRPGNSVLDCSRFTRDFGFSMPEWPQSLAKVVERLAAER